MGISQHVHGTDKPRALPHRAVAHHRADRQARLRPPSAARPETTCRAASDGGPHPDDVSRLTSRVDNPAGDRALREVLGHAARPPARPSRWWRSSTRRAEGKIKGMYVEGENPAMVRSQREPRGARGHRRSLEHLVVQDIFLTEEPPTSPMFVLAPLSAWAREDRHRHQHRPASCSSARRRASIARAKRARDLWIIQEVGKAPGLQVELHRRRKRRGAGVRGRCARR